MATENLELPRYACFAGYDCAYSADISTRIIDAYTNPVALRDRPRQLSLRRTS